MGPAHLSRGAVVTAMGATGRALAQFNVAHARWPLDDPRMGGFVAASTAMNALAERSPGFLWRRDDAGGTLLIDGDPRMTWTLSLWQGPQALADFAFRTAHRRFFRRRPEWFGPLAGAAIVLWWTTPSDRPDLAEACRRKALLDTRGPGPDAFGWEAFPALAELRRRADEDGGTAALRHQVQA